MLTSGHFDNLMSEKCWVKQLSRLRAESARAVTGRRCPHSGEVEDFLPHQMGPLTKTVVTQKRNVKKSIRRCQNDRNAEGYKCPFDNSRGPIAKNGILGQNWCEQSIFALLLHRLKSKIFFHLTLLRHQSIKMSRCKHPETTPKIQFSWKFMPIKAILLLTFILKDPVGFRILNPKDFRIIGP